jgi:sensor histidine kinase YesM
MPFNNTKKITRLNYTMFRKDLLLHLIAAPLLIIPANYFIWNTTYFTSASVFLSATLLTSVLGLLLWLCNMHAMKWGRALYPSLSQTGYRIIFSFLLYAAANITGSLLLLWMYTQLPFGSFMLTPQKALSAVLVMLVAAAIAALGYDFFYSSEKCKESIVQNERLQRLQLHTELNVLKSQVNPHFLFNSLNALSYLMTDDVHKAESYLSEMTRVYRYLLRNNNVALTDLASELQFIRAYFAMLQTANGNGVALTIDIPDHYLGYQIPPLTLQLLVENAVKHNIAHKDQPLFIQIFATPNRKIVVANNLQKKHGTVLSNNVGLNNIAAKYRLLRQPEIAIEQTANTFIVTLPLIDRKAHPVPMLAAVF